MRIPLLIVQVAALAGCATAELSERASKIQVHNQMSTLLSNCHSIGPVTGEAFGQVDVATQQAKNNMRDKTAAIGGDTLVVLNTDVFVPLFSPPKVVTQGNAMKCY